MFKIYLTILFMLTPPSYGFLDSLYEGGKDMAEATALTSAIVETLEEITGDDHGPLQEDLNHHNQSVQKELFELESRSREIQGLGLDLKSFNQQTEFGGRRLSESLRYTNRLIERVKKIVGQLFFSGETTSAYLNTEQVLATREQIKNQQTQILVQKKLLDEMLLEKEKKKIEDKSWDLFLNQQYTLMRRGWVRKK